MVAQPGQQLEFAFEQPPIKLMAPDEIYDRADEVLLRDIAKICSEDSRLEIKPNGIHAKELGEYFSMWANMAPSGGLILIGVRDDTNWEGCSSLSPKQLSAIENTCDHCPDASCKTRRIAIHRDADGATDFVFLIHIQYNKTRVVRTSSGNVYVRRGNRKRHLKREDEVRQLAEEKGEVRFETEPSRQAYPDAFDRVAISDFVEAVRAKKEWAADHSTEDILQLMNLGTADGGRFIPNIACALLFSLNPRVDCAGCGVRFLRFEGEEEGTGEKWNAVRDEFIDGTVPHLVERTASVLKSQLRTFSRLGTRGQFFNAPEYPEFAWYEAIVNACAHRSYGNGVRNTRIFVKMFDDRLEVESPGPFPPFVDPENFTHVPRNPFLMEAMYYLKLVKCAREGTRRMKADMLEMELPKPEWRQEDVSHLLVRVILKNNVQQRRVWVDADVIQLIGERIALGLSKEEKRCINFCAENRKINVRDAERLTGRDWATAKKLLMRLVEIRIFEHVHRADILRDPEAHFILAGGRGKLAKH